MALDDKITGIGPKEITTADHTWSLKSTDEERGAVLARYGLEWMGEGDEIELDWVSRVVAMQMHNLLAWAMADGRGAEMALDSLEWLKTLVVDAAKEYGDADMIKLAAVLRPDEIVL